MFEQGNCTMTVSEQVIPKAETRGCMLMEGLNMLALSWDSDDCTNREREAQMTYRTW